MLVAVITVVSLVLIIGQLTVIQENAPVDDLRERMDGAMAFRQDAEAIADVVVSPAAPSVFLNALVGRRTIARTNSRISSPTIPMGSSGIR